MLEMETLLQKRKVMILEQSERRNELEILIDHEVTCTSYSGAKVYMNETFSENESWSDSLGQGHRTT